MFNSYVCLPEGKSTINFPSTPYKSYRTPMDFPTDPSRYPLVPAGSPPKAPKCAAAPFVVGVRATGDGSRAGWCPGKGPQHDPTQKIISVSV